MLSLILAGVLMNQLAIDSPLRLEEALKRDGAQMDSGLVSAWFGSDALNRGEVKSLDLMAAWAIRSESAKEVNVVEASGRVVSKLTRITNGVWTGVSRQSEGEAFRWQFQIDGVRQGGLRELEVYTRLPENIPLPEGERGRVVSQGQLESKVYPGTTREWWIYFPPKFDREKEYALLIVNDGQWNRGWVGTILDRMIATGQIPPTVAVCIQPGGQGGNQSNRSREYDTLSDAYSRFLLEEVLPLASSQVKFSADPAQRAIMGLSSGGICSFTAAWERPDQFGVAISFIGSFTNIASGDSKMAGGHNYPALIRKTEKKPIRVFLQEGEQDIDNIHGSWPLGNRQMEAALRFAGYDWVSVWGQGFHSDKHARVTLPGAIRWWHQVRR